MRLFIIFALTLVAIVFGSQQSIGQKVTENHCLKEQERIKRARKSIIRTYTNGSRAVSLATAERMATNIEIALDKQCASAVERKLNIGQFRREGEIIIRTVAGNSIHHENFDLTDTTIDKDFFSKQFPSFDKVVK